MSSPGPARAGLAPQAGVANSPDALEQTVDQIRRRLRNPTARALRIGRAVPGSVARPPSLPPPGAGRCRIAAVVTSGDSAGRITIGRLCATAGLGSGTALYARIDGARVELTGTAAPGSTPIATDDYASPRITLPYAWRQMYLARGPAPVLCVAEPGGGKVVIVPLATVEATLRDLLHPPTPEPPTTH